MKFWKWTITRNSTPTKLNKPLEVYSDIYEAMRHTLNKGDWTQKNTLETLRFDDEKHRYYREEKYQSVTEEDLFNLTQSELIDLLAKNDPTLDRVLDDFIVYGIIDYTFDCEDERGNDVLQVYLNRLKTKHNSFRMTLVKMFTSILLRGMVCTEITFDEQSMPSNLFVVDPRYIVLKQENHEDDGQIWVIGQEVNGTFKKIDADTVLFESVNPLLESPRGRSMVASMIPTLISNALMLNDLRTVIRNHAWMQKFIVINQIALKEAGYAPDEIKKIVEEDVALIKNWAELPPEEIPVGTGEIELRQYEGAGSGSGGLRFVDIADRVHERKSLRGSKQPPSMLGSNEFVAESSAEEHGMTFERRMASHQSTVEEMIEMQLTHALRSQGIPGKVNFKLKRIDARERKKEAEVFDFMMKGIHAAIQIGVPLTRAISLYEHITGYRFPESFIETLTDDKTEPE